MKKFWFLLLLSISALMIPRLGATPNIVLIFVDDLGYGDLACYGNKEIKTPNIDRLAEEGQRWTNFYASGSTCVPSRTGLMSGRHPVLLGGEKLADNPRTLLPQMLKNKGYATAIFGKWHLAGYPKEFGRDPMHPLNCGFDYHLGTPGSNDVPSPPGTRQTRAVFDTAGPTTFPVPLYRGGEVIEFPVNQETITKRYTEEAVAWIEKQKQDTPFFLYLAHNMPHAPVFASEKFQNKSAGGRYGDVIEEIDWSVGRIRESIEGIQKGKDTLIVFTSDNGPWTMFGPHGGSSGPLRGEKGTTWEGGQRVPAIFWQPGSIAPAVVDGMGVNLDLYATFAKLCDAETLSHQQSGWISQDLSAVLLKGEKSPRTQWLLGRNAFRSGQYKIHLSSKEISSDPDTRGKVPVTKYDPPMLVNLETDLGETTDLSKEHPDVVNRLLNEMKSFRSKTQ